MRIRCLSVPLLACVLLLATACTSTSFEAPEMQGPAAMVEDAGKPRLWLLTKQEEHRTVSVGRGSRRTGGWRTDTFFHFDLQAFDPATTQRLWKQRLQTFGDPKARGTQPSRVIGSSVSATLLGQDGAVVWLLIGDAPFGINAADGRVLVDMDTLQQRNPSLKGLLPSEAKYYGFDRGLVLTTADARRLVVRGPQHQAVDYVPPPPAVAPLGRRRANGTHEMVPMEPIGPVYLRNATLGGEWLGLYSPKEVADILDDSWGQSLRYPYSVTDEGAMARRQFLRARIETVRQFEDSYQRIAELTPVAGSPTFLKGRFYKDPRNGEALRLEDPESLLVWHGTRMDSAGRLALARLDPSLKVLWDTPLPLSETDLIRRVPTWVLPGHVVAIGELQTQDDAGVMRRDQHLVSVELATGKLVSRQLNALD